MVKSKIMFVSVPLLVTLALVSGAVVVVVPTLTLTPAGPVGPVGPVGP